MYSHRNTQHTRKNRGGVGEVEIVILFYKNENMLYGAFSKHRCSFSNFRVIIAIRLQKKRLNNYLCLFYTYFCKF